MPIILRTIPLWITILGLSAVRCVGTDFIISPLPTVPVRIDIDPINTAVVIGGTTNFQASYYDTLGQLVSSTTFQWTSSNPSVAVIDEHGNASGHQAGQTHIIATAHGVSSGTAILTVVTDGTIQVATVGVSPTGGDIHVGESLQFTAAAYNLNGDLLSGQAFTWRSTTPAVVTIDSTGLATAVTQGSTEIIATASGIESVPVSLAVQPSERIRSGMFNPHPGVNYEVRGTATLEEITPEGRLALSFGSDFFVSDGPGIDVILSTENVVNSNSISLGRVKQLSGVQSYDVPPGVELDTFDWVIIHCVPFNVTFGYARLE